MLAGLLPQLGPSGVDGFQSYVHGIIDGLKQIVEEEELDCEFELRRSFDVHVDAEQSKQVKDTFDRCRKAGHNWTKSVSWIEPSKVEQITSVKNATSAFSVPACSFWPYKLVSQLLARLVQRHPQHLNVQTNTPVTVITIDNQGGNIISTPRGTIRSRKIILATNGYTAGLLPQFKDIIVPIRGIASHIVPEKPVHPHLSNTYNISYGPEQGVDYLNPRPDGSIVVGGGKWLYKPEVSTWYNNFDDSVHFAPEIERYFSGYMQRNFLGWEDSGASVDNVWVGIMGITSDGRPHVGRVPETKNQWMLAGFDGAGMLMILTAAKAVARMVREDLGFDDVKKDYQLPSFFATSKERLSRPRNGCA
jgi:glycine/D-amino acid oxidase-like deaminating enzyme